MLMSKKKIPKKLIISNRVSKYILPLPHQPRRRPQPKNKIGNQNQNRTTAKREADSKLRARLVMVIGLSGVLFSLIIRIKIPTKEM